MAFQVLDSNGKLKVVGPIGATGPEGPEGPSGGPIGPVGPMGYFGLDGADGEEGLQGPGGTPGRAVHVYEQPTEPLDAQPGDFWSIGFERPADVASTSFVQVYQSADVSLAQDAQDLITFNTEVTDLDGFWSAGAPTRLTVPADLAGRYIIVGQASFEIGASARVFWCAILKNGVRVAEHIDPVGAGAGTRNPNQVVYIGDLADGDYIELSVHLENSGPYNILGGAALTFLQMARI